MRSAAASSELFLGEKDATLGRAVGPGLQGFGVGRADFVVVVNVLREHRSFYQRCNHLREKKVRHGPQAISSRGMAGDINTE